jgi:hypothetical protein
MVDRVAVDRRPDAHVIHVCGQNDVLVLQHRVRPFEDADDVRRCSGPGGWLRIRMSSRKRVPLNERGAVPARRETKRAELGRDVARGRFEPGAGRVTPAHGVVGDDFDPTLDVRGGDGLESAPNGRRESTGLPAQRKDGNDGQCCDGDD